MPTGVTHSFGGTVVVVALPSQRRFDLTPAQAMTGAAKVVIEAIGDREFRFAADSADAAQMVADLRDHAARAQAILDNPNEVA